MKKYKKRYTVLETSFGYNVQISVNDIVVANASDGIRCIAQRTAEMQAQEKGISSKDINIDFISLLN